MTRLYFLFRVVINIDKVIIHIQLKYLLQRNLTSF